jgi:hypothetical protein
MPNYYIFINSTIKRGIFLFKVRAIALGCAILMIIIIFSANSIADTEPNNTIQDAEIITMGTLVSGTLDSSSDDYDYYNISLAADVDAIAKLDGPEGADFDLGIYDINGTKLAGTYDDWDSDETIIFRPDLAGTYFIGIWAYDGNGSYTLNVETPKAAPNDTYGLADAIENGFIEAEITGVYDGYEDVFDLKNGKQVFYGLCIKVTITSYVTNDLDIIIPPGLTLRSTEEDVEDKVITKAQTMEVGSLTSKETEIFAMSINMYKKIPVLHSTFEIGGMAAGDLLKIANHINDGGHQSSAGQAAVWMITDDATSEELENIGATSSMISQADQMLNEAGIAIPDDGEPEDDQDEFSNMIVPLIVIVIIATILIILLTRRSRGKKPKPQKGTFSDMEAISPVKPPKSDIPPPRRQPPTPPAPPPL